MAKGTKQNKSISKLEKAQFNAMMTETRQRSKSNGRSNQPFSQQLSVNQ